MKNATSMLETMIAYFDGEERGALFRLGAGVLALAMADRFVLIANTTK
jgi:hypothetical protein